LLTASRFSRALGVVVLSVLHREANKATWQQAKQRKDPTKRYDKIRERREMRLFSHHQKKSPKNIISARDEVNYYYSIAPSLWD